MTHFNIKQFFMEKENEEVKYLYDRFKVKKICGASEVTYSNLKTLKWKQNQICKDKPPNLQESTLRWIK